MDKPHDELELSSVIRVRAIPPKENKSMFHFEIHFSGSKGVSPWVLRAYTQVYSYTGMHKNLKLKQIASYK